MDVKSSKHYLYRTLTSVILIIFAQHALSFSEVERSQDETVIVNLKLDRIPLYTSILAYHSNDGLWIPLAEYLTALDFPITINYEQQTAEGWYINENNTFYLDTKTEARVVLSGKITPIKSGLELHYDDYYVRLDLLDQWFPIEHNYDPSKLEVVLHSLVNLPLQNSLAREKQRLKVSSFNQAETANYQVSSYQWLNTPKINASARDISLFSENGESQANYTINLSGEFLKHTYIFNANLDSAGKIQNSKVEFQKQFNINNNKINLNIGDIISNNFSQSLPTTDGFGVRLSNTPAFITNTFSTFTLRGDADAGWDAELYLNNTLISAQKIAANNQYLFTDVPVNFGNNEYRIELYGPQGQQRTETVRKNPNQNWYKPGFWQYELFVQKIGESTFNDLNNELDSAGNTSALRSDLFLQYTHSDKEFSQWHFLKGKDTSYFTYSLQKNDNTGNYNFSSTTDLTGGSQSFVNWQGKIGSYSLDWNWSNSNKFIPFETDTSEPTDDAPQTKSELNGSDSSIRLNGILKRFSGRTLNQTIQFRNIESSSQSRLLSYGLSYGSPRISLTNNLSANLLNDNFISGNLLGRFRLNKVSLSTNLGYDGIALDKVNNLSISSRYQLANNWNLTSRSQWQFSDKSTTRHSLSFNYKHKKYLFGLDFNRSPQGLSAELSISFALTHSQLNKHWRVASNQQDDASTIEFLGFLDTNNNGTRDDNEEIIPNFGLAINERIIRTNEEGLGFYDNISHNEPVDVRVSEKGLDDPFWISIQPDLHYIGRAGRSISIEVPIIESGEIDGSIFIVNNGDLKPLNGIELELNNIDKTIIRKSKTSYDGFYLFDKLPPGSYELSVNTEKLAKFAIAHKSKIGNTINVNIEGNGDVINGIDFVVREISESNPLTGIPSH